MIYLGCREHRNEGIIHRPKDESEFLAKEKTFETNIFKFFLKGEPISKFWGTANQNTYRKVQLYYPTSTDVEEEASSVAIRCSEDKTEPNTSQTDSVEGSQEVLCSATAPSQAPCPIVTSYENQSQMFSSAEAEHQDGASLTNDDQTVYPDDYTLQIWQKLYEEVAVENTKLKLQQSELRNDIKRTEQENDVLRAENEHLRKENGDLRSKTEELCTKYKKLREDRDAERIMSREDHQELLTENEHLKTNNKELREHKRKLRAENTELRKDWNAESKESLEVIEELRAQNSELKTKNKQLRTEKEEFSARLEELTDQLKELLNQPDSAVCGDNTSSIKDSNNVKAGELSGSSANSPQGDSDGSRKEEEPFLDPLSQDVSKLD